MERTTVVPTVCPYCGVGCGLLLVVAGGRAVDIEYMEDHPVNQGALCAKGNAVLEVLNHRERLQQPLLKQNGGWRRISWEKALDLAASRLALTRQERGPGALGFLGSAKCSNEENYLLQKLARSLGSNNIDHCARLCHAPTVVALNQALGSGAMTNPIEDLENSDCILVIGSNLAENHPVAAKWLLRAKDRGAAVIVADPRLTPTAWLADSHLPIRPGANVALLNALGQVIVREGLIDRAFISGRTRGFEKWARDLQGFSPEAVAEVTGVSAAAIVATARAYAKAKAAAIVYCMGLTQHASGTAAVKACANLALACGHIGRPGAGLWPLRGQNNVQGASDMGALAEFLPGYLAVEDAAAREKFGAAWGVELPSQPGLTVVEMMEAAAAGEIRAMVIMGENPLVSDPEGRRSVQALERLDFLVVQDLFMTETAELADLVLPAAAWAEKEGTFTSAARRVQHFPPALRPVGAAMADWQIICALGSRLQAMGALTGGPPGSDQWSYASPAAIMAEIAALVPAYGGISYDRLGRHGLVWPCPGADHPGTAILHTETFATAEGRARFLPVAPVPEAESPTAAFPLTLTTGRVAVHYNAGSMTRRSKMLAEREPEAFVELHPQDAAAHGVKPGMQVVVKSACGQARVKAKVTDTVRAGIMFMPFHFTVTNQLTPRRLDAEAKIPEFKMVPAAVSREDQGHGD